MTSQNSVAKKKYRSRRRMSESILKKPKAIVPWLMDSKAKGMDFSPRNFMKRCLRASKYGRFRREKERGKARLTEAYL
jgi:hypothetical protein